MAQAENDTLKQTALNKKTLKEKDILKVANVEVSLHAELGRTKLSLKDAVEYDTGSIIPLDKESSEPVNIYVDDILIAKGKIVAIEDNYGVKIVEIIENKSFGEVNG